MSPTATLDSTLIDGVSESPAALSIAMFSASLSISCGLSVDFAPQMARRTRARPGCVSPSISNLLGAKLTRSHASRLGDKRSRPTFRVVGRSLPLPNGRRAEPVPGMLNGSEKWQAIVITQVFRALAAVRLARYLQPACPKCLEQNGGIVSLLAREVKRYVTRPVTAHSSLCRPRAPRGRFPEYGHV